MRVCSCSAGLTAEGSGYNCISYSNTVSLVRGVAISLARNVFLKEMYAYTSENTGVPMQEEQ